MNIYINESGKRVTDLLGNKNITGNILTNDSEQPSPINCLAKALTEALKNKTKEKDEQN